MPNQICKVSVFLERVPWSYKFHSVPGTFGGDWGGDHNGKAVAVSRPPKHIAKIASWWTSPFRLLGATIRPHFPGPMPFGVPEWHCGPQSLPQPPNSATAAWKLTQATQKNVRAAFYQHLTEHCCSLSTPGLEHGEQGRAVPCDWKGRNCHRERALWTLVWSLLFIPRAGGKQACDLIHTSPGLRGLAFQLSVTM